MNSILSVQASCRTGALMKCVSLMKHLQKCLSCWTWYCRAFIASFEKHLTTIGMPCLIEC